MDQAEILIDEITQLRQQYIDEVGSGRRVWPKSIKDRVEKLEGLGIKFKTISQRTGVGYDTLLQWRYKRNQMLKKNFHEVPVTNSLVKVGTVTEPVSEKIKPGTVTVTTPQGIKIIGYDSNVIIEVLKGLSRCF